MWDYLLAVLWLFCVAGFLALFICGEDVSLLWSRPPGRRLETTTATGAVVDQLRDVAAALAEARRSLPEHEFASAVFTLFGPDAGLAHTLARVGSDGVDALARKRW